MPKHRSQQLVFRLPSLETLNGMQRQIGERKLNARFKEMDRVRLSIQLKINFLPSILLIFLSGGRLFHVSSLHFMCPLSSLHMS